MIGRLRLLRNSERLPAEPSTAPGDRIYAIGDVHGRADLLAELIGMIDARDRAAGPDVASHLVLLGDLIDRGEQSAQVLDMVRALQGSRSNVSVLLGNHEQVLLDVLGGSPAAFHAWLDFGGDATLASFGVDLPKGYVAPRETIVALAQALPPGMQDWLHNLPLSLRSGDYFFCHAGVRPGVALARQSRHDLLWIRDDFLASDADHGVVVVHGHSVSHVVEQAANRIGIDTGAHASGRLTALMLEGTAREILTTGG